METKENTGYRRSAMILDEKGTPKQLKEDRPRLIVKIDLENMYAYETDVANAIRDEILSQVKAEARKQCRGIRDAVAAEMIKERQHLIDQAISQIKTLKLGDE